MAQYGGEQEQYKKEEGCDHNQLHSTTTGHEIGGAGTNIHSATTGHDIGGTGTNVHSTTEGYNVGGTGTTIGAGGYEEGKHSGAGGGYSTGLGVGVLARRMMEREAGGRRKVWLRRSRRSYLAAIMAAMSTRLQPLPTATVGGGEYGYKEGEEGHEKKGLMDKIKEKLPGSHQ